MVKHTKITILTILLYSFSLNIFTLWGNQSLELVDLAKLKLCTY